MNFDFLTLATRFLTSIVNSVSPVELWVVSQLIPYKGSVHSLGTRGLILWLYRTVSLSPVRIVSHDPFSVFSDASTSKCLQTLAPRGLEEPAHASQRYSRLSVGCAVLMITTRKKRYSHLSGGFCCWWEIGSFFVVAGNFYYDRKKKDTVVCLASAR
jgi:hypothetical protein